MSKNALKMHLIETARGKARRYSTIKTVSEWPKMPHSWAWWKPPSRQNLMIFAQKFHGIELDENRRRKSQTSFWPSKRSHNDLKMHWNWAWLKPPKAKPDEFWPSKLINHDPSWAQLINVVPNKAWTTSVTQLQSYKNFLQFLLVL